MSILTTACNLFQDYRGLWQLTLTLTPESVQDAKDLFDNWKPGKIYEVIIQLLQKKRSLAANAYFHALATKIAAKIDVENDEAKRYLVKQYGTLAEVDGYPVTITIPKGAKPEDFYPYCEWLSGDEDFDTYILYKQTHVYDSAEFARLIDGTVAQCKLLGIETLPPAELARLYAQADKSKGNPESR